MQRHVIVKLVLVIEKRDKEFVKIRLLLGQFFGCAAHTEHISMAAVAPTAPQMSMPNARGPKR